MDAAVPTVIPVNKEKSFNEEISVNQEKHSRVKEKKQDYLVFIEVIKLTEYY